MYRPRNTISECKCTGFCGCVEYHYAREVRINIDDDDCNIHVEKEQLRCDKIWLGEKQQINDLVKELFKKYLKKDPKNATRIIMEMLAYKGELIRFLYQDCVTD